MEKEQNSTKDREHKQIEITTLAEDIRQIGQRPGNETPDMIRFCSDHRQPILLHDEKPVFLEIGMDQFICIFDQKKDHYFPSPKEIFRFAVHGQLDLPAIVALMIKAQWEIHVAELIGYPGDTEMNLDHALKNTALVSQHLRDFRPDNRLIFDQIGQVPYETSAPKARKNINLLIHELMLENVFLLSHSAIVKLFPKQAQMEKVLLANASKAQRDEYTRLRDLWKIRSAAFEKQLLLLEKNKRDNANVMDAYFRTFGKLELVKSAVGYKEEKYRKVLELRASHPALSLKELLKMASASLQELEKKRAELQEKYARSLNCFHGLQGGGGRGLTEKDMYDYESACTELLKKLYRLLHPDTYDFKSYSEDTKERLHNLWLEVMQTSEEANESYAPGLLLYSQPDYYRLYALLRKTCEVLQIDIDNLEIGDQLKSLIRKGSSINKIIKFLKTDLESLQLHLSNLELIARDYTNEDQTMYYREALSDPEARRQKLEAEINESRKEIIRLKESIRMEFKKVVA